MMVCLECGKRLDAGFQAVALAGSDQSGEAGSSNGFGGRPGRAADFCSSACRRSFNNRRALRGAELYDLVMTARFDRPLAKVLKVWGWIARLATSFRDEDRRDRGGRPSWRPPAEIRARKPWIAGRILDRGRAA